MGGNNAHGAMFDAVQWAHLHQHRNIGDAEVLLDIAESLGHPRGAFADHMHSDAVCQRVQDDRAEAAALGIRSIPTVIGGNGLRLQTLPLPHLRQALAPWSRPEPHPPHPARRLPMTPRILATALALLLAGAAASTTVSAHERVPSGQQVGTSPWGRRTRSAAST